MYKRQAARGPRSSDDDGAAAVASLPGVAALSPAALGAARRYSSLDWELYRFATQLFETRLARMHRDRAAGIVCRLEGPIARDGCSTVCYS